MSDIRMDEIKKGDVIFLKKLPPFENGDPRPRVATVVSKNIQRNTILIKFRLLREDGEVHDCKGYIQPSEVLGFHISGTPM